MLLAHKIELRPTPEQAEYFDRACGTRRHAFNQLLAHFQQDGVKWSKKAAYVHYIQTVKPAFPWYGEVSARVSRNAIDDLDNAFKHFFRRVKLGQKPGFPRFKKKDLNDSFAMREAQKFDVNGRTVRIEKCPGRVAMRQRLRFGGETRQVTISKRAGKYYAAILVETEDYDRKDSQRAPIVGVDLGITNLTALSDGTLLPANQRLKANLRRLKRRSRNLSRKQRGSNRRAKAKTALAKLHKVIADQRAATLHEVTDMLTSRFDTIVLEDLNVKGMAKRRSTARAIADAGFGTFRAMVEYKAALRGNTVILADRWFPSSQNCSRCGSVKANRSDQYKVFHCGECGFEEDRDLNAALNLEAYGLDTLPPDLKRAQESGKTGSPAHLVTA